MNQVPLHWVIALPAEAKPLRQRFGLAVQVASVPFPVFRHRDGLHWLTVSGPGKTAAAAATASLFSVSGQKENGLWINVGIAGNSQHDMGALLRANKITDAGTSRAWFPAPTFQTSIPGQSLITVDRPQSDYDSADLYDMEASGFIETALRFSTVERVHSLKIVSDHSNETRKAINAGSVTGWMASQLDALEAFTRSLISSLPPASDPFPEGAIQLLEAGRFSVSQQHQFRKLVGRCQALSVELPEPESFESPRAKTILAEIENRLQSVSLVYPDHD
ncbi:MAG: hypothetical protein AAF514_07410 [Verrucomicrobiota bacterium]